MKRNMKRTVICIFIVAMLMTSMTISAFAADTVQYTIKEGDTVLAVCNKLGVDFYANQQWITAVNHINNYRDIKVGKVLILPLFNTQTDPTKANALLNSLAGSTTVATAPTNPTTIPAATTTTPTTSLHPGDSIVSYLVVHVMQPGETVFSVCNALGVDFAKNSDKIMKLSNITSWNRVAVGKKVIIPSSVAPAGSTYTAIVAHKVQGGETVGSICTSYGLNYGAVQTQLKALNNTENLNVIKVGQTFYLPLSSAALAPTVGTVPTAGSTVTVTPTTPTAEVKATSVPHGTFKLQVDGKDVTTAAAGQKVTIVASPEPGYEVDQVTIIKVGGGEYVVPTGMSFTMPNFPITVNVTFRLKG